MPRAKRTTPNPNPSATQLTAAEKRKIAKAKAAKAKQAEQNKEEKAIAKAKQAALQLSHPKPWQVKGTEIDLDTGEVKTLWISKYKYFEGRPKQIRFDAKSGRFNFNGEVDLGNTISFQPIAWRIFTDEILNFGKKTWAEIFFIDKANCVCAILFHGYSVEELYRLMEPLFYEDLHLNDVVLTVTPEKKENPRIKPTATYYIARFSYKKGQPKKTKELKEFAEDHKLFRQETLTDQADTRVSHHYYNPNLNGINENPEGSLKGEIPEPKKEEQ